LHLPLVLRMNDLLKCPSQMFLTAPETKGKTLEEMDDVFDRGIPAWKTRASTSRLDQLARDIETGELKVGHKHHASVTQAEVAEPKL
jgi:hypothetical protein